MKRKYNIAFTPIAHKQAFIQLSERLHPLSDLYHLGDRSIPHVTLCHFFAEETHIDALWESVCRSLQPHSLHLSFPEFSYYTKDNSLFWISLRPDHRDILTEMHETTAIKVGIPVNENYDSHLTLINTRVPEYKEKSAALLSDYSVLSDEFVLSLGDCDKVGQMTQCLKVAF